MRILVRAGVVDEARANELEASFDGAVHPIQHWVNQGVGEDVIADSVSSTLKIPRIDIVRVGDDVYDLVPAELVHERLCIPIQLENARKLILGMVDPTDIDTIDEVRFATNLAVEPRVISLGKFRETLEREYPGVDDPPIARLVNLLLVDMIKQGDTSLTLDPMFFYQEMFGGALEELEEEAREQLYGAAVQRLRDMAEIPAGVGAYGTCILRMGDEASAFFCFDFRHDDSEAVIRRLSRDAFEQAFGPVMHL